MRRNRSAHFVDRQITRIAPVLSILPSLLEALNGVVVVVEEWRGGGLAGATNHSHRSQDKQGDDALFCSEHSLFPPSRAQPTPAPIAAPAFPTQHDPLENTSLLDGCSKKPSGLSVSTEQRLVEAKARHRQSAGP
jgi:hypothetical protein